MKYLLVIGDGMADKPLPQLDEKTPLEYSKTPTMDALASAGVISTALTIPNEMSAGSDTAILSIFGYDPKVYLTGRAPLEAAAKDIKLEPGDIAYRCNLATFEDGDMPFHDKAMISHSAGAIEGDISDMLITELCSKPDFAKLLDNTGITIYPGGSFRHIAVQCTNESSLGLAQSASMRTTPPHDHIGESIGQFLPSGNENAALLSKLMMLAHEILDSHPINIKRRNESKLPANGIWFWAEGTAAKLPNFTEKYGKTGAVISAVPLCQGIAVMSGLGKILVEGATGELYTNYEGKVEAALEALKTHDFVTVHIEAPDECTHNGDLKGKLQAIEWIDSRIVKPLVTRLSSDGIDFRLLLISDHMTLISTRGHDGSPVPYVMYDSRIDNKTGKAFHETDAALSNSTEAGTELMEMLFKGI
jgi:2,3-bisphosphoglycerate-independent phosphoglycerate mutase